MSVTQFSVLSPSLAYKLCSSPLLPAGRRDDSSAANQLGWVLVYAALDLLDKKWREGEEFLRERRNKKFSSHWQESHRLPEISLYGADPHVDGLLLRLLTEKQEG